jgi:hypothetical protein
MDDAQNVNSVGGRVEQNHIWSDRECAQVRSQIVALLADKWLASQQFQCALQLLDQTISGGGNIPRNVVADGIQIAVRQMRQPYEPHQDSRLSSNDLPALSSSNRRRSATGS